MDLYRTSVGLILASQDPSGAYPASPSFEEYRYCWVRDGSFIAAAMDASGEHGSAAAFHRWTARTVMRYRDRVEALAERMPEVLRDGDVLHPRFTADGTEPTDAWHNHQPDSYGWWLTAVGRHVAATGEDLGELRDAVELVARYLALLWDRPSADCWEGEPDQRHPTTLAAVARGLRAAGEALGIPEPADLARRIVAWTLEHGTAEGALSRFAGSDGVDGSALFVLTEFGPFEPGQEVVRRTVDRVEADLVAGGGGVFRFLDDTYYGGGLWVPLAGALAQAHAALGNGSRAEKVLAWMEGTAGPTGHLPEQTQSDLRSPEHFSPWVDRWGPPANPLLWSHAMYVLARLSLR